jgi:hypothetical protein
VTPGMLGRTTDLTNYKELHTLQLTNPKISDQDLSAELFGLLLPSFFVIFFAFSTAILE